ncbi:hypothetical protein LKO27_12435 [Tessaracoccus sp. OS52]|uniref:hypothetical protein n=1 Tax=Tessaracoccus sp. OS52 TaxID=2886691 RepID=UPI001D10E3F2|nr:hypothetical protein [Tessaracoccus sp. OS52]MCC2594214.1 hypothetical protein [Tessaracoccus sp. OS52]
MKNALLPAFGGPMGRHARPRGHWFNPLPWTILTSAVVFTFLALRQVPCVQTDATNPINAFIRLCYSDIPLMYTGQGFGLGNPAFGGDGGMLFPPVLGVVVLATVRLAAALGADIRPDADVQVQLDGAEVFFAINAVVLFVFFLAWTISMVMLGRDSANGRFRSWDGMLVAASPVVLAAGLIHWDLLPIGITAVGLLQFAQRRTLEAGIILGLAAAAGTMPIIVVAAVAVCIALRGNWSQQVLFLFPAVVTWAVVHLPLVLNDLDKVISYYQNQVGGEASYGSVWFLMQVFGWNVRAAGYLGFMILLFILAFLVAWLYVTKRRPRVGTLVAIFVFVCAFFGAAYSPQTALWLLFALVLARPFKLEYLAFTIVQLGYYLAIWGWLSGHLTAAKTGPQGLYFLAIIVRLAVDLWLLYLMVRDVQHPEQDRLRAPDHSDPIGGELVDREELQRIRDEDLVAVA